MTGKLATAARRLTIDTPSPKARPLAERGRMLFVPDVVALFGGRKGKWWVANRFAPEHRLKAGRDVYWWECDALAWLDRPEGK